MSSNTDSTEVAALADQVRSARAGGRTLRIVGAGSWLTAGRPCDDSERLEIGALTGIVTYEPGDLTLTARAGTSLAEIQRVTAAEGQWLPLQPMGAQTGTLGATVATSSYGPLASAYGTPRDQVLGCEFVSGTGDMVRAGGRVVKNVAGFDLVRLVTGAWGTLGALTELTVRLRARPEVDHTVAVQLAAPDGDVATAAWRWLRESEHEPLAAELLSPSLARSLLLGSDACLLVRLAGNEPFVRAAGDDVRSLGEAMRSDVEAWHRLACSEPSASIVVRLSALPSRVGALWTRASAVAERCGGFAHATVSRGLVRCVIPDAGEDSVSLDAMRELVGSDSLIAERVPAAWWRLFAKTRPTDALSLGVRRAFDPGRIMNPGILGDSP